MKEVKKKKGAFGKKYMFVALTGLVSVVVIAFTMNMAIRKETENAFREDVWENATQSMEENQEIYQEEAQAVSKITSPEQGEETPKEIIEEPKSEEKEGESNEETTPVVPVLLFEKPVPGEITKDYSGEELVYSDTMEDWRVHEGIDFRAEEKTEVKAVADGTVETVSQDGLFGACLMISHPDGFQTFYGNMEEGSMPSVGTQVKTGDSIGRVGKTATVEINDEPHLHFEVRKDGKAVNPHDFLQDTVTDDE